MALHQTTCNHPGCCELQVASNNNYRGQQGVKFYRKWCQKHYEQKRAETAGLSVTEYAARSGIATAKNAGFNSLTEYTNSIHPYRQHRKDYCENRDGRLNFVCRYKIRHPAQLQVDHINGDPSDNRPKNLQTLCANCHLFKTHWFKDYATAGRKTLNAR